MVINSPSAAYMRYWTGLSLVQVMACRLVGANLLQWLINLVGGQLCDMAYIVPMHVKPKFTYLLTYLLGAVSIRKTVLPGMAIPMLKIRRPNGRLIFNMEITIRR